MAKRSRTPDPSSGAVSSQQSVGSNPGHDTCHLSKAYKTNYIVKHWEGIAFYSTSQTPSAYVLTDCEGTLFQPQE